MGLVCLLAVLLLLFEVVCVFIRRTDFYFGVSIQHHYAPIISVSVRRYVNYFDIQVLMMVTETETLTPTLHHNIFPYLDYVFSATFILSNFHPYLLSYIYIYIYKPKSNVRKFLSGVEQVLIQSFPSHRLVAISRLSKNLFCLTNCWRGDYWMHTFAKCIDLTFHKILYLSLKIDAYISMNKF